MGGAEQSRTSTRLTGVIVGRGMLKDPFLCVIQSCEILGDDHGLFAVLRLCVL